jgi:protein ImuB
MPSLVRRLDLPGRAAGAAGAPVRSWFEGIGCISFGELRRLPRPGLQRRCGRALLDLLDAAYGTSPSCTSGSPRPKSFARASNCSTASTTPNCCWPAPRRLLLQLTGWLCARQLAVERIVLSSNTSGAGWRARRPASRWRWPNRPGATSTWCAC